MIRQIKVCCLYWTILNLIFFIYTSCSYASNPSSTPKQSLYKGEQIIELAGYPALVYFESGQTQKPLIVFVTGGYNLARISYGIPGTHSDDFLAYWAHEKGFPFLGLSYPLDNKVFKSVYPSFTMTDWAKQIVEAAKQQIIHHHLPNTFVMLGWSMAGKAVVNVNEIAQKNGLKMVYISLSSDPPMRGLVMADYFKALTDKPTTKGLSSGKELIPWFLNQIHQQNKLNHHVIISDSEYVAALYGDQPVDLLATSTRFYHDAFIKNPAKTLEDTKAMNYDEYPMIGLIHGDQRSDYINALFTTYDWSPMLTRTVYNQLTDKIKLDSLTEHQWDCMQDAIRQLPGIMSKQIHGNHLFFIGQYGAQQTMMEIESLLAAMDTINKLNTPDDICAFIR